MSATFKQKPKVIECTIIWRMDPYIRPIDRDHVVIMQRICYLHNGQKQYTDVILEKTKKANALTRFRRANTRTKNARENKQLGIYKLEVAS